MAAKKTEAPGEQIVCVNRQARHNYFIDETYEAGLILVGSEVKSLRDGKANLVDSYARIQKGEAFLVNTHISPYAGRESVQSRADAHAQAFVARTGDRAAHRQNQRARLDPDSAQDLFQKRPGQSRTGTRAR